MWAIGREAETKKIGLDKAGVQVDRIGKIHTVMERTNVPHIYAIGDIIVVRFFAVLFLIYRISISY